MKNVIIETVVVILLVFLLNQEHLFPWNNGPSGDSSTDEDHPLCENIPYSTHDWIADHARALLPEEERKWIDDNKKLYLLGTEAPDNDKIPDTCNAPNSGYDDRNKGHSVKWKSDFSDFEQQHDRAAFRAKDEYLKAENAIKQGNLSDAAYYAGAMAHYVGDVSQYGHSVDFEQHHSDYEGLISTRTASFNEGVFEGFLVPEGLSEIDSYDAVKEISLATSRGEGNIKSPIWMDSHYTHRDDEYWNSVGASLNKGVNVLADVLHTLYKNNKELIDNPSLAVEAVATSYTVQPGDTLGTIAKSFYGDGRRWRTILAANKDKVDDPKNLQIGTILVIP